MAPKDLSERLENSKKAHSDFACHVPEGLSLLPHQAAAVEFILSNKKAYLADEQGLGKTIELIVATNHLPNGTKGIIVSPAAVTFNWVVEFKKWDIQDRVVRYISKGKDEFDPALDDVIVISYDLMAKTEMRDRLSSFLKAGHPYNFAIFDEAHYMKNRASLRGKSGARLIKESQTTWLASGTPIPNDPSELWNVVYHLKPKAIDYQKYWAFVNKYCVMQATGFGQKIVGVKNAKELSNRLRYHILFRRKKSDVLKDLPDKIYSKIVLPPSAKSLRMVAKEAEISLDIDALIDGKLPVDGNMSAHRRELGILKAHDSIKYILEQLEENKKLVVFGIHKDALKHIQKELTKKKIGCEILTGDTPSKERVGIVKRFQEDDDCRVFIGNVKAAGVGLTLTASSKLIFVETPWVYGDMSQAEDRIHRIGQTKGCMIEFLVYSGSIDEAVFGAIYRKKSGVDAVIEQ